MTDRSTCPTFEPAELIRLQTKIDSLAQQLDMLHDDIQFTKGIFVAKQAKKEKRRQEKERQRLEEEQEEKNRQARFAYEQIVWTVRNRPWDLVPGLPSRLSPKELELVSLMLVCGTDQKIASRMNIKEGSVAARICAANKKLRLKSRQELIDYYLGYRKSYRDFRWQGCLRLLSWLLNPPPGQIYRL